MSLVSGSDRQRGWTRAARAVAGLLAVTAGLAGCVTTNGPTTRTNPDGRDIVTASDQTDADRAAKVRLELAGMYFGRGQATDALDEVKQVLALRPNDPAAYGMRGLIYASLGDAARADDSFRRAQQLAPHDGDLMHNYAWFLCQQQRYPEADTQFSQALAEPTYRAASRTLLAQGVCQARAGRLADSERTLSRSYELDPANPATAVNLAQVLYKRGEFERARFYIRRVNTKEELLSAQSLWLGARIERKLGQDEQVRDLGAQLHRRFAQSPETLLFEKGRFDE